ncbi:hypothetical protein [Nocardia xishanensis]
MKSTARDGNTSATARDNDAESGEFPSSDSAPSSAEATKPVDIGKDGR